MKLSLKFCFTVLTSALSSLTLSSTVFAQSAKSLEPAQFAGLRALPDFARNYYFVSHIIPTAGAVSANGENPSFHIYAKYFVMEDTSVTKQPTPLYMAFKNNDGDKWVVYDLGLSRWGANVSEPLGPCQWIYGSRSDSADDRVLLISEPTVTSAFRGVDIYILTQMKGNTEDKLDEQICRYSKSRSTVKSIVPTAVPAISFDLQ